MAGTNHGSCESVVVIVGQKRKRVLRDKVGNVFADLPDDSADSNLRITFRRRWYSPPFTDEDTVDYKSASAELAENFTGGTLVLRGHLESGDLGPATEIALDSKDELEVLLRAMRKVFKDGLKQDNAVRQAGLENCTSKIAESETVPPTTEDQRVQTVRRQRERRTRPRFGRSLFRKHDRRLMADRRDGLERRIA